MCCPQNITMCDYQESVTTGQTETWQTDTGQSDPYMLLGCAGDTKSKWNCRAEMVQSLKSKFDLNL